MAEECIGPSLPPEFREPKLSDSEDSDSDSHTSQSPESGTDTEDESRPKILGPIGPTMPPNFPKSLLDEKAEESDSFGPALPPSLQRSKMIGPVQPTKQDNQNDANEYDDDDDMIGPKPHTGETDSKSVAEDFERRALHMKRRLNNPDEDKLPHRESWMLELPEKLKIGIGLQARQFKSSRSGTDDGDTSCWTDTPADKAAKSGKKRKADTGTDYVPSDRDIEMQEQVDRLNVKRVKSLFEMHQDKLHKKSKKEKKEKHSKKSKKKEKAKEKKKKDKKSKDKDKKAEKEKRRPFDRDLDLKVNQFDDAMRKNYIKKAQGLSGNFAHSSAQKFL